MEPTQIRERQIITYKGITPRLHPSVLIASGSRIVGGVVRDVRDDEVAQLKQSANNYMNYVCTYTQSTQGNMVL